MLDLRRRNGRVGGREVWSSGPLGRRYTGDFELALRRLGSTDSPCETFRRDGQGGRMGFVVDMVHRPSLRIIALDGHEIFKVC